MNFLYPIGFLALLGVPVLILIYIIKNKYTEQVIPSTYLWTLSEKFLKKRLPINKLVGIISLILQILAVILIAFAVAHPVIVVPDSAYDYCLILDGSASMNLVKDGKTRLDSAKEELLDIISDAPSGSVYSLIFAGNAAEVYENISDKDQARKLIRNYSAGYTEGNISEALGGAQDLFQKNNSLRTYFATDKDYRESHHVMVINVSGGEQNYAVSNVSYTVAEGTLTVEGEVVSYASDAVLTLELYLDDLAQAFDSQTVQVQKLERKSFSFICDNTEFRVLKVAIAEEDSLLLDNEAIVYNVSYENAYQTLLVSDAPFFIEAALHSANNSETELMSVDEFKQNFGESGETALGYSLYIFDSYAPAQLPSDGAIWLFNPPEGIDGAAGFVVQDEVKAEKGAKLDYAPSGSGSELKMLLKGMSLDDVFVSAYKQCGLYRRFTTVLTCDGMPVVFTGSNNYGNREVVFAFDLHSSNFSVLADYMTLARNLLNFMFPTVIENVSCYAGDTLTINLLANCASASIVSPVTKKTAYLDAGSAVCETVLSEVGTYTLTLRMKDGSERTYNVFSALPEEERDPASTAQSFSLLGTAGNEKRDGTFDHLWILVIVLALLMAADWVVYCYEQYQLR